MLKNISKNYPKTANDPLVDSGTYCIVDKQSMVLVRLHICEVVLLTDIHKSESWAHYF